MSRTWLTSRADRPQRGFTLVEILVVVAIVSILILLSMPGLQKARVSSYEASAIAGLKTVRGAFEMYHRDYGYYPALSPGFSTNYLDQIRGYLPPEVTQAGVTDEIAKGYELRAMTDTFPNAPTDTAGRILGSHIFTLGAFPLNPELGLRTFFMEAQGTVTKNNGFDNM